jgi:hypothetical protein
VAEKITINNYNYTLTLVTNKTMNPLASFGIPVTPADSTMMPISSGRSRHGVSRGRAGGASLRAASQSVHSALTNQSQLSQASKKSKFGKAAKGVGKVTSGLFAPLIIGNMIYEGVMGAKRSGEMKEELKRGAEDCVMKQEWMDRTTREAVEKEDAILERERKEKLGFMTLGGLAVLAIGAASVRYLWMSGAAGRADKRRRGLTAKLAQKRKELQDETGVVKQEKIRGEIAQLEQQLGM